MALYRKTGGGSRKGRKNKRTLDFREHIRDYCDQRGVDPHEYMADLLADTSEVVAGVNKKTGEVYMQPAVSKELKLSAAKELAQYMQPRLKAMDVAISGNADKPLILHIRRGD